MSDATWKTKEQNPDLLLEHQILIMLVVSDRFLKRFENAFFPELLDDPVIVMTGAWCIEFYRKFGTACNQQLKDIYNDSLGSVLKDDASIEFVKKFLIKLSKDYENGITHNEDHMIERTEEYFKRKSEKLEGDQRRDHPEKYDEIGIAHEKRMMALFPIDVSETPNINRVNPFPLEVMGGAAGEFAETMSKYMEPPPEFFFMAYLTCLGNIASGRIRLNSSLDTEPRLYLLVLGESADDRKSTAISKTVSFFHNTIEHFATCSGIGSAEGLQRVLGQDNRLLLVFDEFKAFVSKSKIDSSVLLPAVATLLELKVYESHTKTKSISIENASLSILAASTVDTYQNIFDPNFLAIGFPNRIFLCVGRSDKCFAIPKPIPDSISKKMREQLTEVIDHLEYYEDGIIQMHPKARRLYEGWYAENKKRGGLHSKRLDTYGYRLMILFAINEKKKFVDVEIVERIIKLLEWQHTVRCYYDPIDADNVYAAMEEKIRRVLRKGPQVKGEIRRLTNAYRSGIGIWNAALKNLMDNGEVRIFKKKYQMADMQINIIT